jgi:hypothetical protein
MKTEAYYEIFNEKGKLEKRVKAKSFVLGLIDLLYIHASQEIYEIKDTLWVLGNAPSPIKPYANTFEIIADSGNDAKGILVGSGATAPAIGDYKLETKIVHGTDPTQLSYGTCDISEPATFGNSRQFSISRTFTNNAESSITVNEVGLVCEARKDNAINLYILIERSLLQFVIAASANKTVVYTIKVTV